MSAAIKFRAADVAKRLQGTRQGRWYRVVCPDCPNAPPNHECDVRDGTREGRVLFKCDAGRDPALVTMAMAAKLQTTEDAFVFGPPPEDPADLRMLILSTDDPWNYAKWVGQLPENQRHEYPDRWLELVARVQNPTGRTRLFTLGKSVWTALRRTDFDAHLKTLMHERPKAAPHTPLDEAQIEAARARRAAEDAAGKSSPNMTDAGNAQRFARVNAGVVRHCTGMRQWFAWEGLRWAPEPDGFMLTFAKQAARDILWEAFTEQNDTRRRALSEWAMKSESAHALQAMLTLAESEADLPIRAAEFDADPWLLNCPNGMLDLRTGTLRPQSPDDLVTRMTAAPYHPGATHPVWDTFLARAFPDAMVRRYVQKWAGYSITGDTREDTFAFSHGPTKSGKTTFNEAMAKTLGDYATTADITTFAAGRPKGGSPREDVARLRGVRCVISSEVPQGMQLDVAHLKQWTGGDTLVARTLYKGSVEFTPAFKITIACNDLPEAPDTDAALWERIVVIPWPPTIPAAERDPAVKLTLRDPAQAGAAVLAWLVEGCRAWQAEGLGPKPSAVETATRAYRTAMNPIAVFAADMCQLGGDGWTSSDALWRAYTVWCKQNGKARTTFLGDVPDLSRKEFGQALARLDGVTEAKRDGGTRGYRGITVIAGALPGRVESP